LLLRQRDQAVVLERADRGDEVILHSMVVRDLQRQSPLPPAHYLPFLGHPLQQLAQRAFFDPGGGRNVSNCHFLLSLPESLKIEPSA
jgi:hypothetical protein